MTIASTNITFSSLQTEFGGSDPISLSEYYRGGAYFKNNYFNHTSYPQPSSSGQIAVGNFRQSANPHINNNTELNTLYEIDAVSNYMHHSTMILQANSTADLMHRQWATGFNDDSSVTPDYSSYVTIISPNFLDHMYYDSASPFSYVTIKTFVVPIGCTYVDIEAWGAGGGGAGKLSLNTYTGSYGGSGGYCTTRLVVGTHINEGDVIFCSPGLAGASAPYPVIGGTGGGASIVWKNTRYLSGLAQIEGQPGVIPIAIDTYFSSNITDNFWKLFLNNNVFNINQAVLCAGGGGGGSAGYLLNGANGGGGGADGSDGISTSGSGANTRATSNNNFTGYVTNDNYTGEIGRGGNVWPYHGAYTTGTFKINGYTTEPAVVNASLVKAWFSSTMCDFTEPYFEAGWYSWGPSGGGGFYTSGAGQVFWPASDGQNRVSRGGGGGTNEVYLGINTQVSNGGSPNPPVTTGILTSINSDNFCSGGQRDVAASSLNPTYATVGSHGQKGKIALKFIG